MNSADARKHGTLTRQWCEATYFHSIGDANTPGWTLLPAHIITPIAASFQTHGRSELPDVNGLEFQRQLSCDVHPPIVFLTGHGDIPSSVRAIQGGAVDFLTKPVGERELIAAVRAAILRDRKQRSTRAELAHLVGRFSTLTPREREVLPLVDSGLLNKQAAAELGISEITLEIHRSKIMHKMEATSFADLVRIAEKLQIPITHSRRPGTSRECPTQSQ